MPRISLVLLYYRIIMICIRSDYNAHMYQILQNQKHFPSQHHKTIYYVKPHNYNT